LAGDRAVATGRSRKAIADVLGPDNEQLLSVKLDVANAYQARPAVDVAVAKFGAIDVLVNNAGYGHVGFLEELTAEDAQAQFATNVNGVLNVTWAVLPLMRRPTGEDFQPFVPGRNRWCAVVFALLRKQVRN
jgi:NAD(P)-dependent dehydrogenase (short-subunit alcohol dehydrogenase family)